MIKFGLLAQIDYQMFIAAQLKLASMNCQKFILEHKNVGNPLRTLQLTM